MSASGEILRFDPSSKRIVVWGLIVAEVLIAVLLLASPNTIHLEDSQVDEALKRGFAAQALGRDEDAERAYQAVLENNPQNILANYNQGVIEQKRENFEDAESYYQRALSADPNFVPALFNLAILREKAGDNRDSERLYRKVIEIDPAMAKAHLNLGFLLLRKLDRDEEGKAEIIKAVELDRSLVSRVPSSEVPEVGGP